MFRVISTLLILIPSAFCCGGNFVLGGKDKLILLSPNYPFPFPAEGQCIWKISTTEGAGFNISCPYLYLVSIDNCKYTRIEITSGHLTKKVCSGYDLYDSVEGNSFDFKFTSNIGFTNNIYDGFFCVVSVFGTHTDINKPEIFWPVTVPDPRPTSPPHRCNCGLKKVSRIVGGEETAIHEYPWQVAINFPEKWIVCGGTLISEKFVLTAAHCLERRNAHDLTVSLGEHDRTTSEETQETIHLRVTNIIVHEEYDQDFYYNNDIALLELSKPITFTAAISPACLPYGVEQDTLPGEMAIVTGWGANVSWGGIRPVLREVELPMISTEVCRQYYYEEDRVSENMFCTYYPGKDSCKGDSGGPLVWSKDGSQYYLVGIVSWGNLCAADGKPGVYTKVTNYLDWIEMKTKHNFCNEVH